MRIIDTSELWSFAYSFNFQIRQNPVKNHHFSCEESLLLRYTFQSEWDNVVEHALTRCISRWSYPWNWFYRCSRCKNTFVRAVNLQMITSKFWFEYLWGPHVLFLDQVLCIALVSSQDLGSWLHEKERAC